MSFKPLLSVSKLTLTFPSPEGVKNPVQDLSFEIEKGRTLGMVGESGSGKSMTANAIMRLVPSPGKISQGSLQFQDTDLLAISEREMQRIRGNHISMIFQDPSTSFNPVFKVGDQIAEALRIHDKMLGHESWQEAIRLLGQVGIPNPEERAKQYPHQMSGGMKQRAMIAMALACDPALLIADEPTTALDVTVQAQILDLLIDMQEKRGTSMLFISHDLAVISEVADDIIVMLEGRAIERGAAETVINSPRHDYTKTLLEANKIGGET